LLPKKEFGMVEVSMTLIILIKQLNDMRKMSHLHAVTALRTFGFIKIDTKLGEQRWHDVAIHN
jgi:hypothetical protein